MESESAVYHRNVPNNDLLSDLIKVAAVLGKVSITSKEYDQRGTYSSGTISRRFGGWNKALQTAGLAVKFHHNTDSEAFINDLIRVAEALGKNSFTGSEYDKHSKYGSNTVAERFGSWNKALEMAGLTIKHHQKVPIGPLLENIGQVWLQLGKRPGKRNMRFPLSKYSEWPYKANFGSWQKALERFLEVINSEEIETEQTIEAKPEITPHHKTKKDINWRLRFLVMRRDNFKCSACGKSPANDPGTELHVDRVVAWDEGGETVFENLRTVCSVCDDRKSKLDFTV